MRFRAALALGTMVSLSGCLPAFEQPFGIHVMNDTAFDWSGRLVVLDDDGDARFDEHVTVPHDSFPEWEIGELVGDFTFRVIVGNKTWEGQRNTGRGDYDWSILLDGAGGICFEYHLDDYGVEECPVPQEG